MGGIFKLHEISIVWLDNAPERGQEEHLSVDSSVGSALQNLRKSR